jgi:hypothetical protein
MRLPTVQTLMTQILAQKLQGFGGELAARSEKYNRNSQLLSNWPRNLHNFTKYFARTNRGLIKVAIVRSPLTYLAFLNASINSGTTWNKSPTIP